MTARTRVGVLISGSGSNMAALADAARGADAPFEIALVLSNRPDAGGLAVARGKGVAVATVDHSPFVRFAILAERAVIDGGDRHPLLPGHGQSTGVGLVG